MENLTISEPIKFFRLEQNDLNNNWMVFSDCEQISNFYAFKSKKQAQQAVIDLDIQANIDYLEFKKNSDITWKHRPDRKRKK